MSEQDDQVSLVSRWKLKAGLDKNLLGVLQALAGEVEAAEPGTLMYRVHLPTKFPLPPGTDTTIPFSDQQYVVFVEIYRDAAAFAVHTQGDVFKKFLKNTSDYFEPDPNRPGWPVTDTDFMTLVSGFARDDVE